MKIGFIGLGNMAEAMISGLLKKGIVAAGDILGADVNTKLAEERAKQYGIHAMGDDNRSVAQEADYLVLAVKPQFAVEAIHSFRDALTADKERVIISIMAGKSLEWIEEALGSEQKVVRCMPNTAALVGEAITAVTPNERLTEEEIRTTLEIIGSFGKASVVPEHLMDAVVGVSGSAPAYVFMFIEAMADAAVEYGMPRKQAYEFAAQAVCGSAKLMMETHMHPGELKDMVCSPAGTTIAAVRILEEKGFRGTVMDAVEAAAARSREL